MSSKMPGETGGVSSNCARQRSVNRGRSTVRSAEADAAQVLERDARQQRDAPGWAAVDDLERPLELLLELKLLVAESRARRLSALGHTRAHDAVLQIGHVRHATRLCGTQRARQGTGGAPIAVGSRGRTAGLRPVRAPLPEWSLRHSRTHPAGVPPLRPPSPEGPGPGRGGEGAGTATDGLPHPVSDRHRVVIEVDGKQHYAQGDKASPALYADLVKEDRRLRLDGYELYRFGGYELVRPGASTMLDTFFDQLASKMR